MKQLKQTKQKVNKVKPVKAWVQYFPKYLKCQPTIYWDKPTKGQIECLDIIPVLITPASQSKGRKKK